METTSSKKFVLEIDLGSGAIASSSADNVAATLRKVADRIETTAAFGNAFNKAVQIVPIYDENEDCIGAWNVKD